MGTTVRCAVALVTLGLAGSAAARENVLLIIADDVGVDRIAAYREHPSPGATPNLDQLAERGVLFRNVWSNPTCSPTRASILTGRYPFRNGIGAPITAPLPGIPVSLAEEEWTLPEVLRGTGWTSVVLGKWHLAIGPEAPTHPLESGFDRHLGSLSNVADYFVWPKNVDGTLVTEATYATIDTTDDAIAMARRLPEPWFLWVAYNAAHAPFHAPPSHLHDFDLTDPGGSSAELHKAMVQAMDTEIGRLLGSLDPEVAARTTVIFIADNGTQGEATEPPFVAGNGKGTIYEGGVNVPLIVAGPRVARPGSECTALVHATDLFATVAGIAGVDPHRAAPPETQLDSVSLLPYLQDPGHPSLRTHVFAERFKPNGLGPYSVHQRAIRDGRFKLVASFYADTRDADPNSGGFTANETSFVLELYDLQADPLEQLDLLAQGIPLTADAAAAYAELRIELALLVP